MPAGSIVEAEIRAQDISVQLVTHCWPTPVAVEFSEAAADHVIALQRQPPQQQSVGRYGDEGKAGFSPIGKILAIPAGRPIQIRASGGIVQAVRCAISPAAAGRITDFAGIYDRSSSKDALDIRVTTITAAMRRMGQEARAPGFASSLLVESLSNALMVDLARYLSDAAQQEVAPTSGGLTGRQLRLLTEFIEGTDRPPVLGELARLIGISRRHLTRAFRQSTGQTVHGYVEESRYRKASTLLVSTDLMLKDIAARVGFSNACSFATAFRKVGGETPMAFRRRMRPRAVRPS